MFIVSTTFQPFLFCFFEINPLVSGEGLGKRAVCPSSICSGTPRPTIAAHLQGFVSYWIDVRRHRPVLPGILVALVTAGKHPGGQETLLDCGGCRPRMATLGFPQAVAHIKHAYFNSCS